MQRWLTIPHRVAPGLCPVNGIRDLVQWRLGRDWSNPFLFGLGLGGGFAYLRFNAATPPRQIYWGQAGPRQHRFLAELLGAGFTEVEGRSFKFAWSKVQRAVDAGTPPVLGPLDMFYLSFYPGICGERHIPIHYLLLVGYDAQNAYVHDTGNEGVQSLSLAELERAWDVNVPGLGKRNRYVILDIPQTAPATEAIIRKSVAEQCRLMLRPPVSLLGIPAMQKLAGDLADWPAELGADAAGKCLLQVREYLSSPPDLLGHHLTAGRDLYVAFLEEAGALAGLDFSAAIARFRSVIGIIPQVARAIDEMRLDEAAAGFHRIAEEETSAYQELSRLSC